MNDVVVVTLLWIVFEVQIRKLSSVLSVALIR